MARSHTGNVMPRKGLRVRVPCLPLVGWWFVRLQVRFPVNTVIEDCPHGGMADTPAWGAGAVRRTGSSPVADTMGKIMIDMPRRTKEKLLEHFGKSKPDFFGISYISLEEGIVLRFVQYPPLSYPSSTFFLFTHVSRPFGNIMKKLFEVFLNISTLYRNVTNWGIPLIYFFSLRL